MKFNDVKDINKKVPVPRSFKHYHQMAENGGRIVKGVNTTPDVSTDEIKTQAAKFGNKVDKDGRPPTLSKKVKGSKTNVLFNLGMSESVNESKELASASEIYVDMDGVLVDFFGEWTKMMGVSDWKQIKNVDQALQKIRDKDDFWLSLKPTKNAGKLLSIIKKIKGEYNILSAPLAGDPKAEPHKREWISKYLKAFPPKNVIITADKQKYATQADGTPNILIDDFGQNVSKWEASGGVGFKHKDHKFERTATQLADYISPERNEEIAEILGFTTRTPKRATIKKKRPPEELSVKDKVAKRRAMAAKGNPDAFKSGAVKEGDLVLNHSKLRSFIIDMISDKINKTDDVEQLSKWLKLIVGKEVAPRGAKSYTISAEDVVEAISKIQNRISEGDAIPNPKNTFLTKSDTAYDHYKVGTNLANLKKVPKGANYDEPDIVIAPYAGQKEMKYLMKQLKRIGYDVQDAAGYKDAHYDEDSGNESRYLVGIK